MISSYLQILERRYDTLFDDAAKRYFTYAKDGAQRMSAMIRGILDYSKVGNQTPIKEEVETATALGDALDNLDAKLRERNAKTSADVMPRIRCDRVLVGRLFQILISNAIKFCEQEPSVRVQVMEREDDWMFSVADNGIGIPPDGYDRLFKIFERLHPEAKYRGTGIGLATCKKIVDLHDGRMWVESTVGVGSIFCFSLSK